MVSKLTKLQKEALYLALKKEQALPKKGRGLKLAGQGGDYSGMGLDLGGQGLDLGGQGKKKKTTGSGGYKRHMVKGSQEARDHMSKLIAMRKKK